MCKLLYLVFSLSLLIIVLNPITAWFILTLHIWNTKAIVYFVPWKPSLQAVRPLLAPLRGVQIAQNAGTCNNFFC